jgi:hypothetical protein
MGLSVKDLEAALRNAVEEVYRSDNQNNLTVRFVRVKVESELGLDQGFFLKPDWKDRSKALIKSWAVSMIQLQDLIGFNLCAVVDKIDGRRGAWRRSTGKH